MPKRDGAKKALVRRVKKAVKRSRRRLGAEKFEKELTRTITFLENLQRKLTTLASSAPKAKTAAKTTGKSPTKTPRKPARKAATKKPVAKPTTAAANQAGRRAAKPRKK